jgi:hypothetical protein
LDRTTRKKLVYRLIEEMKAVRELRESLECAPSYSDGSFSATDENRLHQAALLVESLDESLMGFFVENFVDHP